MVCYQIVVAKNTTKAPKLYNYNVKNKVFYK